MSPGIYRIINTVNKLIYIGSAYNLFARFHRHIYELEKGIHHNKHLQADWVKYGPSAFSFEVIEECRKEDCLNLEAIYILNSNSAERSTGYNILNESNTFHGLEHSKETLEKMSKTAKANWNTLEGIERRKEISRLRKEEWASGKRDGQNSNKSEQARKNISKALKKRCQGKSPFSEASQKKAILVRKLNPDLFRLKLKAKDREDIRIAWENKTEKPMQFCKRLANEYKVSLSTIKCIVYKMKSYKVD